MGYKSKFKGEEIDARLEKMVNVTYAELKALRDEGKLIAGQMYRMTDYETTCTWENTQVAGHPFDLVLTALDNKTLDEKCSAIWSERDKDGYFANSNLPAWDVRYCLDNDMSRFDWAFKEGKYLIADDGDEVYVGILDGTIVIDGQTYYKWTCTNGWAILCTLSKNPSAEEEIIICEIGYEEDYLNGVVVRTEDREGGKGVVYRLIDESRNDVPYDFKNIMFSRPLTEGKYDAENGVDTFCYTFCCIDWNTFDIADQSVAESRWCTSNKFQLYCYDNVFLTFSGDYCNGNTFGDYCNGNTFGNSCKSNTFGDNCYSNTFGDSCESNTFGNDCYENTFGNNCYENIFRDDCFSNTFGGNCYCNTFGDYCHYNTFGGNCYSNTFGDNYRSNTFGVFCYSNTFGVFCYSNTFRDHCSNNTFGGNCYSNTFGDNCESNTFGNSCQSNTFGDSCESNTFRDHCSNNIFGNDCNYNIFGVFCESNTFGNECSSTTFGVYCSNNTFKDYCYSNTFGDYCMYNTFGDPEASSSYKVRRYHVTTSHMEIQAYNGRSYDTYITSNSSFKAVEYTVEDIINK